MNRPAAHRPPEGRRLARQLQVRAPPPRRSPRLAGCFAGAPPGGTRPSQSASAAITACSAGWSARQAPARLRRGRRAHQRREDSLPQLLRLPGRREAPSLRRLSRRGRAVRRRWERTAWQRRKRVRSRAPRGRRLRCSVRVGLNCWARALPDAQRRVDVATAGPQLLHRLRRGARGSWNPTNACPRLLCPFRSIVATLALPTVAPTVAALPSCE